MISSYKINVDYLSLKDIIRDYMFLIVL